MYKQEFIEKAIKGGWHYPGGITTDEEWDFLTRNPSAILLDPLAWRSAGFSEKEMLGLVSALWSGSTIENYLKML